MLCTAYLYYMLYLFQICVKIIQADVVSFKLPNTTFGEPVNRETANCTLTSAAHESTHGASKFAHGATKSAAHDTDRYAGEETTKYTHHETIKSAAQETAKFASQETVKYVAHETAKNVVRKRVQSVALEIVKPDVHETVKFAARPCVVYGAPELTRSRRTLRTTHETLKSAAHETAKCIVHEIFRSTARETVKSAVYETIKSTAHELVKFAVPETVTSAVHKTVKHVVHETDAAPELAMIHKTVKSTAHETVNSAVVETVKSDETAKATAHETVNFTVHKSVKYATMKTAKPVPQKTNKSIARRHIVLAVADLGRQKSIQETVKHISHHTVKFLVPETFKGHESDNSAGYEPEISPDHETTKSAAPNTDTELQNMTHIPVLQGLLRTNYTYPITPTTTSQYNEEDLMPVNRIVGGEVAEKEDWKFLGSLSFKGEHFCGVTLLSPDCCLTAAHCVTRARRASDFRSEYDLEEGILDARSFDNLTREPAEIPINPLGWYVRFGVFNITNTKEGISIPVDKVFPYPGFIRHELYQDLAMVKLQRPVDMSRPDVALVHIAQNSPARGTFCQAAGWGDLLDYSAVQRSSNIKEAKYMFQQTQRTPDELRTVDLPVISSDLCYKIYGANKVKNFMLCTMVEEGGQDACQGDSGGPLMCDGQQAGITSWGEGCAKAYTPGVFTDVAKYRNWISLGCMGIDERNSLKANATLNNIGIISLLVMFVVIYSVVTNFK